MVVAFGYVLIFNPVSSIFIRVVKRVYVRAPMAYPVVVRMAGLHLTICLSYLLFGCLRPIGVFMGVRSLGGCRILPLFLEVSQ